MGRTETLRGMNIGDAARLCVAVFLLVSSQVGVLVSFHRSRSLALRLTRWGDIPGEPLPDRIVWAIKTADWHLPGGRTCLVRSLATETFLRAYGYVPKHRIGVDKIDTGDIKAHSWIEYDGEVLIGELADLEKFEPLSPAENGNAVDALL